MERNTYANLQRLLDELDDVTEKIHRLLKQKIASTDYFSTLVLELETERAKVTLQCTVVLTDKRKATSVLSYTESMSYVDAMKFQHTGTSEQYYDKALKAALEILSRQ